MPDGAEETTGQVGDRVELTAVCKLKISMDFLRIMVRPRALSLAQAVEGGEVVVVEVAAERAMSTVAVVAAAWLLVKAV